MMSSQATPDNPIAEASTSRSETVSGFAIVITGAASGIGREIARLASLDRQPLLLIDRNEIETIAGEFHSCEVGALTLDLRDATAISTINGELSRRGWYCDVLVNAAGFGTFGSAADLSAELQLALVDVNVRAVTALTLEFLPSMITRGRGGVLNLGSITGYLPGPYMATYFASKAYIESFSASLAAEAAGTGATVTCLTPGVVRTAFFDKLRIGSSWLFKLLPRADAEVVASAGWRGFRAGRRHVIPRWSDWLVLIASRLLPNRLLNELVAKHWRGI